nr:hypothetical protein [Nonomuraea lactucae]
MGSVARVERDHDGPQVRGSEERLHELRPVGQEDADVIATLDAQCGEPARHLTGSLQELQVAE